MKMGVIESPKEIEKEFNRIKSQINEYILQRHKIPPNSLFQKLDREFKKVTEKYKEQNDQINLLYVEHNYLWSKAFQYLSNDPTRSLSLIIKAISKLLDRHELRPYPTDAFGKMLGTYKVALIKIAEKKDFIDFDNIEEEFLIFIKTYSAKTSIGLEILIDILVLFIDNLKITDKTSLGKSENLIDAIKSILKNIQEKKVPRLASSCYENLYKIRKKQLHYWLRFIFFEKTEEKRQSAENEIDRITKEMIDYSKNSFKYAKKYINALPSQKQNDQNIKIMVTLKEIDELTAKYYKEAYSTKDILEAGRMIDKIKHFLIVKAFKENVPLSDNLLKYYAEEWSLLYVFAKICLLKDEISKRNSSLTQDWEKDMFEEITKSLENVERLFKYEMKDKKDYTLKIMTSTFAGGFSEYFIHELCQEFFDYGKIDKNTPSEFRNLLECIKSAGDKDNIKLNDVLEQNRPDIDIHIKNKCAIFLKNSKIESDEMKKIWNEIELCRKKGISKIFYGINFIKNIEKIEYIRKSFEKIRNHGVYIDVFDIKDLVIVFLNELKRCGKSKLNFTHLDLYRVLDY